MNRYSFYTCLLVTILVLSCTGKSKSPEEIKVETGQEENTPLEVKTKTNTIDKEKPNNENILLFSEIKDEIEYDGAMGYPYSGVSNTILEQAIYYYLKEFHLMENDDEFVGEHKIEVSIPENSFSYDQNLTSDVTEYDLAVQRINKNYSHYFSFEDDPTDEEMAEVDEMEQAQIDAIDPTLKEQIVHDHLVGQGNWKIIQNTDDEIKIELKYHFGRVDATTYSNYAEFAVQMMGEEYTDTYSISISDILYEMGSKKYLSTQELKLAHQTYLPFIRNWFYAKKGYDFKTEKMKIFFSEKEWYNPVLDSSEDILSPIELLNVKLIKELEK